VCPETGIQREICNGGFEKGRETLKKLCPEKQMGITFEGRRQCPMSDGNKDSVSHYLRKDVLSHPLIDRTISGKGNSTVVQL